MIIPTTITTKGQVTIPLELRQLFDFQVGQRVEFVVKNKPKELVLKPAPNLLEMRGYFKSTKKYNKKAARKAYMKDVLAGRI